MGSTGPILAAGALMHAWQVGALANAVTALAYLAISRAIVLPLARARELRSNKLGAATALIFFTCAVHHGSHAVHSLLPYFHTDLSSGIGMRRAFDWEMVTWDVFTAGVGVYYWTLRRSYGSLLEGSKLFEDYRQRQREALEINDTIVQGLVAAQLALATGRQAELEAALVGSLGAARRVVDRLLVTGAGRDDGSGMADFVRDTPAHVNPS